MSFFRFLNAFNTKILARFITKSSQRKGTKLKAQKINALRQKYEAYIEDDRKRKERNDYILSQLDKMRTSNNLVRKRNMLPFAENVAMFQKVTKSVPDTTNFAVQQRHIHDQNYIKNSGQNSFLRNILSNYILVPKALSERSDTEQSSGPQHKDDDNWKAKYNILNVLKNAEKSGSADENTNKVNEFQPFQNRVQSFDIVKNVQEKDIFFDEMIEPSVKYSTENFNSYPAKVGKDVKDDDTTLDTTKEIHESKIINEIGHQKPEDHIKGNEKLVYDDENGLNPAHIYYPHEDIGKPLGDIPTETEDVQYPVEIINVNDFTPRDNVILKDGVNVNPKIEKTAEKPPAQQPADNCDATVVISTKESLESQSIKEPTDKPPVKAIDFEVSSDTVHISSEPFAENLVNDTMDRTDNKDIQEFENEQEMFYQTPDVLENPNPLEQPEDVFAPLVENFQDQQYYYVAPHETPESVHISEHEETSSPYDQSYAQQYMTAQSQEYAEAPASDVVKKTDNQWNVQAVYDGEHTYQGQEQLYDSQQVFEGQQQQYDGQQQQYDAQQQQQYDAQQQQYDAQQEQQYDAQQQQQYDTQQQQYEGRQDVYEQNHDYENSDFQPEYTAAAYDAQNDKDLRYSQELYPADGTFDSNEAEVERQLDKEEGLQVEKEVVIPK